MKKSLFILLPMLIASLTGCSPSGYKFEKVSNENGSMSYEIFVRSFYDTNGDGIGDINGIKEKLPYLYDLGIKTVWLMPIHKSPSYHGYDTIDYYTVNTQYGTLEDFDNLVNEANKYHIDIMLDMVFNHCSTKNQWFAQSYSDYVNQSTDTDSKADWFNWRDTYADGYNKYNDLYYESRFSPSMPDFNLDSAGVRKEIDKICKFWIQDHGVKGFRLDAVLYYYYMQTNKNVEFLSWLEETTHQYAANFYMVGEGWSDATTINSYHNSSCDSFFRFDTAAGGDTYNLISLAKGATYADKITTIEENEAEIKKNNSNGYASYFLTNHDQDRASKYFDETQNKCAASLLCLMPGTPFMYYGEEIQLKGERGNEGTDAMRRLPMIWSKSNKTGECKYPESSSQFLYNGDQVTLGVEDQIKKGYSLLNHYKKVINIRNKYPFLKQGVLTSLCSSLGKYQSGLFAYRISLGDQYINVIHNFSSESRKCNAIGNKIVDEINTSKKSPSLKNGTMTIAPYSSIITQ